MEPTEPSRGTKRPLTATAGDDDDGGRERKPRFPKGKKAKYRDAGAEGGPSGNAVDLDSMLNPELAAERRARQRHGQLKEGDDAKGGAADVKGFEVRYNDGVNFVDDGIRIEPFNLEREREEGYFDENGNFVEYARDNQIKDAWLDSVEVDPTYVAKVQNKGKEKVEEFEDLSSDDIGRLKRLIANLLEPGETIMQALKRLKSTSTDKRGRMAEGTKRIFDELTEAAMKLMENGDYNVYSDDRETFEREAAGYERLTRARLGLPEVDGVSEDPKYNQTPSSVLETDQPSSVLEMELGPSTANISTATAAINDDDSNLDMFGDDDNDDANRSSNVNTVGSGFNPGTSDVKIKFTSLALFFLFVENCCTFSPLPGNCCVFFIHKYFFSFFLQKPIMEAWTQTMSMILLQAAARAITMTLTLDILVLHLRESGFHTMSKLEHTKKFRMNRPARPKKSWEMPSRGNRVATALLDLDCQLRNLHEPLHILFLCEDSFTNLNR